MRRRLRASLALVGSDHGGRVDGQPLVRVDCHTEEARVGLWRQEAAFQESNGQTGLGQSALDFNGNIFLFLRPFLLIML